MAGKYSSSLDEANLQNFGFRNTLDQLNKLAQMRQEQAARDQQNQQFQASQAQQGSEFQQGLAQKRDMPGLEVDAKLKEAQGASDIQAQASKNALQDLLTNQKNLPQGAGASEEHGGASITKPINMGMYDLKKQNFDTTQVNKYATAMKPLADVSGAAADLERVTNRDGKGGVFTNPNAKLVSAGKVNAAVPDSLTGIASFLHVMDPGAAEERKAIARYRQSLGVSLGGARGMSPAIQQGIQNSMGQMASEDPQLMAKGIRGAGRITGAAVQTAQSGFTPDIRSQAHMNSGMSDPADFYKSITPEAGPPANQTSPLSNDPGNVQSIQPQSQPQGQEDPITQEMRRRGKIK